MKLTDLNPKFVGAGGEGVSRVVDGVWVPFERREGVGLQFDCPCGCGDRCFVYFKEPIDGKGDYETHGAPSWDRKGDDFETMTLHPSILRTDPKGCCWHGFVREGIIVEC